jgi:serine protease Do
MIKTLKPLFFLIAASLSLNYLNAQNAIASDSSTPESIIINKKKTSKEKITVVIDGDNVTVNGKPVEDFKSNDVDIIKKDLNDGDFDVFVHSMPAMAPRPPQMEAFQGDMMRKVKTNTAFLGVMTEKTDKGAKITEVTEGSAAEKAGLKEGDIITKIGEDNIAGPDDLYKAIGKRKPDDKVAITYTTNGKQATTSVTLGKSEQMKIYSWNTPQGDDTFFKHVEPFNYRFYVDDNRPRLGIEAQDTEDGTGVKILGIDDEDSPGAKAGLKEDDIITQINGKTITSTEDLKESMKGVKKGDTLKITYKRNNQIKTADVKLPKELKTIDL